MPNTLPSSCWRKISGANDYLGILFNRRDSLHQCKRDDIYRQSGKSSSKVNGLSYLRKEIPGYVTWKGKQNSASNADSSNWHSHR
jgi:hypothetical protein